MKKVLLYLLAVIYLASLQMLPLYARALTHNDLIYARNQATTMSSKKYTTEETIYRLLRKYPENADYDKVDRIIMCESGYNSDAKNPNSTASGYFQFLYNTWYLEVLEQLGWSNLISPFDGERNLEGGIFLLSRGQDWRWESSRHCWDR